MELADESFATCPSQYRAAIHDAVEEVRQTHGFLPRPAVETAETSTLVSFVAAGVGVALVPVSVAAMALPGIAYRRLAGLAPRVVIAVAWRRDDDSPVLARGLRIVQAAVARGIQTWVPFSRAGPDWSQTRTLILV